METQRTITTDGGKMTIKANLWEKYGKHIIYFNDVDGKLVARWDVDQQKWTDNHGIRSQVHDALKVTFADIMGLEIKAVEKTAEKPFMPWLGENNPIARPVWAKASVVQATRWLRRCYMPD